jgi:hypothetical protein
MRRWLNRLRFLWEEEIAPPEEVPRGAREDPAGVPRPLRTATRFVLIGSLATSWMSQIIGVRMIAPVDAAPLYRAQCLQACEQKYFNCIKTSSDAQVQCYQDAKTRLDHCKGVCKGQSSVLGSVGLNSCLSSCDRTYTRERTTCAQQQLSRNKTCQTDYQTCKQVCNSGT